MLQDGCAVCGSARGLLACSRCRGALYCGPEHQRQHWPQHRAHCTACFEVRTSPELGRHLLATRLIPKGTVIVKERALAVMPLSGEKSASCANCCRKMQPRIPSEWAQCGGCGLPLCSLDCGHNPVLHTGKECDLLRRVRAGQRLSVSDLLGVLSTVRCLSLTGAKARALRGLASNPIPDLPGSAAEMKQRVDDLVEVIRGTFGDMFKEQDVRFVQGVLHTNSYMFGSEGEDITDDTEEIMLECVFEKMSLLQHSCLPNAKYSMFMNDRTDFSGAIIAEQDIPAGRAITISYVSLLDSTQVRMYKLFTTKNFMCRCERCEDPSELGLHLGSVCCQRCKLQGRPMSLLEATGTTRAALATFRCKSCGLLLDSSDMLRECLPLYKTLSPADSGVPDSELPQLLEDFLQRAVYPNGLLHATASAVVRSKFMLLKLYGGAANYSYSELPDALLARKLSLCRDLKRVVAALAPGYSDERYELLKHTAEVLLELGRRSAAAAGDAAECAEVFLAEAEQLCQEIAPICIEPQKKGKLNCLIKQINDIKKSV